MSIQENAQIANVQPEDFPETEHNQTKEENLNGPPVAPVCPLSKHCPHLRTLRWFCHWRQFKGGMCVPVSPGLPSTIPGIAE